MDNQQFQMKSETDVKRSTKSLPPPPEYLPPCRVCGNAATGFHYGANTCGACKAFFFRSLNRNSVYRCSSGSDTCEVHCSIRLICCYCRYQKCLEVGMCKEAIRNGRYTHATRTRNILEVKKISQKDRDPKIEPSSLQRMSLDCLSNRISTGNREVDVNQIPASENSEKYNTFVNNADQSDKSEIIDASTTTISDPFQRETVIKIRPDSTLSESSRSSPSSTDSCSDIAHNASDWSSSVDGINESHTFQCDTRCQSEYDENIRRMEYKVRNSLIVSRPENSREWDYYPPRYQMSVIRSTKDEKSCSCIDCHGKYHDRQPPPTNEALAYSLDLSNKLPLLLDLSNKPRRLLDVPCAPQPLLDLSNKQHHLLDLSRKSQCSLGEEGSTVYALSKDSSNDLDADEMDKIIEDVTSAYKRYSCFSRAFDNPETLKLNQMQFSEKRKETDSVLGELRPLSNEEHQDFVQATGIDLDNRYELIDYLLKAWELESKSLVQFAKCVPGFRKLSIADQSALLKSCCYECCLLEHFRGYNFDAQVILRADGDFYMFKDVHFYCDDELYKELSLFVNRLLSLRMTSDEIAMIIAVVLTFRDRAPLEDPDSVEEIQLKLVKSFRHLLAKCHPDPNLFFYKVWDKLIGLRNMAELNDRKASSYLLRLSNTFKYPLAFEMISGHKDSWENC